jgi:hypothetical protein
LPRQRRNFAARNLLQQSCDFYDFCRDIAAMVTIFAATMPQFIAFWLVAVP